MDSSRNSDAKARADSKKKRELPPLFWYMESSDWEKATERIRKHPREVKTWATLKTKEQQQNLKTSSKRLALHHACFKLRSAGGLLPTKRSSDDPYVQTCRFILLLIKLYPEAASQRESRHGCLPLHLAAFASCAPRVASPDEEDAASATGGGGDLMLSTKGSMEFDASESSQSFSNMAIATSPSAIAASLPPKASPSSASSPGLLSSLKKPNMISRRVASDATTNTNDTGGTGNLSAIHAEESYAGEMKDKELRRNMPPSVATVVSRQSVSASTAVVMTIPPKREEMAVQVVNALLDAYPKGARVDSEGGRLPLHTAVAGRATPRVVETLIRANPSAARHRNKDGFLPLHLAAHWGVSHPAVAIALLKSYPDATLGRNRWERTPLEEALCMAGENGRPHQQPLVRALRKHPTYWTKPVFLDESRGVAASPRPSTPKSHKRGPSRGTPVDVDESLPDDDESSVEDYHAKQLVSPDQDDDVRDEAAPGVKELERQRSPRLFPRRTASGTPSASKKLVHVNGSKSSSNASTSATLATEESVDLMLDIDLATLIKNRRWKTITARMKVNHSEAEQSLQVGTKGGFTAVTTPLHFVCESQPPASLVQAMVDAFPTGAVTKQLPGGCLALHIACTWYASAEVVTTLLNANMNGALSTDELGNVPLHSACFSGADVSVVAALLQANGKAVMTRNTQGSRPIDICKRLRHPNRKQIIHLLTSKKEEIMLHHRSAGGMAAGAAGARGHRRSNSSGTWSEVASIAFADLNNNVMSPASAAAAGQQQPPPQQSSQQSQQSNVGVEIIHDEEGGQDNLMWI